LKHGDATIKCAASVKPYIDRTPSDYTAKCIAEW
jgi:hypothetical protein